MVKSSGGFIHGANRDQVMGAPAGGPMPGKLQQC
jgi:hypothetical protein